MSPTGQIEAIRYLNCGDWVESCTALVEHHDGRLEIVDWGTQVRARKVVPMKQDEVAA